MPLEQRKTETRVKHLILSKYLDAWAGIITSGLSGIAKAQRSRGRPFTCRLLYVDGFSHNGRYAGDAGDLLRDEAPSTWGSPIIGIQALDKAKQFAWQTHGLRIETAAILTEIKEASFNELEQSLDLAGLTSRVVRNPSVIAPTDGQIVAIRGNFLAHVGSIIKVAEIPYTWSFFLLDPFGPTGIPYPSVSKIVKLPKADVMINLMYLDLQRRSGELTRTAEEAARSVIQRPIFTEQDDQERQAGTEDKGRAQSEARLENYDAAYGNDEWRRKVVGIAEGTPEGTERGRALETALVQEYEERLQAADSDLVVKRVGLEFPDVDRIMFYLFLTTRDPSGALALNKILYDAKLAERGFKLDFKASKWLESAKEAEQLSLFGEEPAASSKPADSTERDINIDALTQEIWDRFQGRNPTMKQIYASLGDSNVFMKEVDRAMTQLKNKRSVWYDGERKYTTVIHFNKGR